jgi:hypothetical protein
MNMRTYRQEEYTDNCNGLKLKSETIQFKSVFGIGKLTIQPARDRHTNQLKGVRMLSDEEKRHSIYWVTPDTKRTIESGFTLDLSNCIDATDWLWIQHSRGIGLSQDQAMYDDQCMFYVWDENKEAAKKLTRFDLMRKALNYIADTPNSELAQKARLLGEKWDGLVPSRIRQLLNDQSAHPSVQKIQEIIDIYEDKDSEDKLFLYNLIDKGIVRLINNVYKYGDITLGIGETQAVVFLQDPKNQGYKDELFAACYPEFFSKGSIKSSILSAVASKDSETETAVLEEEPKKSTSRKSKKS